MMSTLPRAAALLAAIALSAPLAAGGAEPNAPATEPGTAPTETGPDTPLAQMSFEALQSNPRFKRVIGTRVHMLRPTGFIAAKGFLGLQSLRGRANIVVTEEPTPLAGLFGVYTDEALEKQGLRLISREPAHSGPMKGELIVYRARGGKGPPRQFWTRYFGGRSRRFVITATSARKRADEYDQEFKEALKSARFRLRDPDFDPFEGLSFDIPGSREIAFAKRSRDQLIFTRDGRFPLRSREDPAFVILVAAEHVSEGDRDDYCVRQLEEAKELEKFRIVAANTIERDGLPGCESLAHGTELESTTVVTMYQAALFGSDELYLFKGRMGTRYQTPWLNRMRDMVLRFKRR